MFLFLCLFVFVNADTIFRSVISLNTRVTTVCASAYIYVEDNLLQKWGNKLDEKL
jgi:hypothetical protein